MAKEERERKETQNFEAVALCAGSHCLVECVRMECVGRIYGEGVLEWKPELGEMVMVDWARE